MQDKSIVQMILNNGFFLITAGLPLLLYWKTPTLLEVVLLVGVGSLAGFAQFTLFEGMKRAPASVIAPFEYTALVWAFLLGYLIWRDVPRYEVFIGAILIVGAGLIIVASEHFRAHRTQSGLQKNTRKKSSAGMEPIVGPPVMSLHGLYPPPEVPLRPVTSRSRPKGRLFFCVVRNAFPRRPAIALTAARLRLPSPVKRT